MIKLLLLLGLAISVALAAPSRSFIETSDSEPLPAGWRKLDSSTVPSRDLELIILLKQRNTDTLLKTLDDVSDPRKSTYGKYLTLKKVSEMVAPSQRTIDDVIFFLKSQGIKDVQIVLSRDMLVARVSSVQAARIFNAPFHLYRHTSGATVAATLGPYSLPSEIAQHIDVVSGLVGLPEFTQPRKTFPPAPLDTSITPSVVRTRYNVTQGLICTNETNMHAVAEFQSQYYSPADLQTFWSTYVDFAPFRPVDRVIGANDGASLEGSLDIQYIMGVAPNATTWFYSMKNWNFYQDLTRWAKELNNEPKIPYVHSVSYGSQGNYPTNAYQERFDMELAKLGVRGVTILLASGDYGSGCSGSGSGCDSDCILYPSFPATCSHVTSVGATRFLNGENTGAEGAVTYFLSGGGFSYTFPTGKWQADAVKAYLTSSANQPEACSFNATGRATPDVAALGDIYFQVIQDGSTVSVGGTSASSPSFAAIITLLNDKLLNAGKPTLGYLNPWVYQTSAAHKDAFFDVTQGNNDNGCCASGAGGFYCINGWDPVTGVGTPNFDVLKEIV